MITGALIGPARAGKSTLCDLLEAQPVSASDDARRQQYLELGAVLLNFGTVDVDRPVEVVAKDVAALVMNFLTCPSGYGAAAPAAPAPEQGVPT